jgi:mono/diheme cytochrome c family protein
VNTGRVICAGLAISGAVAFGLAGTNTAPRAQTAPKPYAVNCQVCHKADGSGTPGVFPRLSGRLGTAAGSKEGRQWLVSVVLYGQSAAIIVDGKPIRAAMLPFQRLPDADVAAALNWVVKGGKSFSPAEVAAVRGAGASSAVNVGEMRKTIAGQLK